MPDPSGKAGPRFGEVSLVPGNALLNPIPPILTERPNGLLVTNDHRGARGDQEPISPGVAYPGWSCLRNFTEAIPYRSVLSSMSYKMLERTLWYMFGSGFSKRRSSTISSTSVKA